MSLNIIFIELILYLLWMLIIGIYFSRKKFTQADYHIGGKKIVGWALALSERATGESAWLILGLTGFAFFKGFSAIWIAIGCVSGIAFSWVFLAKKFREEAEKYNVITYTEYLVKKHPEMGNFIRWYSSLIIIFFYIFYISAQFEGGGKVLNITFKMPIIYGMLISAIVVIIYSMAGGFFAVVFTDVIQSIIMILTFIATPVFLVFYIMKNHISLSPLFSLPNIFSLTGGLYGFSGGIMIFSNLSWFFGYLGGQPQLSTRWMAMKNNSDVKKGMVVALLWTIFAYSGAISIGILGNALVNRGDLKDPEFILPTLILKLFPDWFGGILLVGAIAAMMSTASSQLLLTTTSISEDIYHKALGKDLPEKKLVLISRITLLLVGFFALFLTFTSKNLIYTIVSWAWAGIGCSFSPVIILSFFWKRFNSAGAVASLITGSFTTIIWMVSGLDKFLSSIAASFIFAFLSAIIFTHIFEKSMVQNKNRKI